MLLKNVPTPPRRFLSIPPLPNIFAKFFLRGLITFLNSFIRKNRKASFGFLINLRPVPRTARPPTTPVMVLRRPPFSFSISCVSESSPSPSIDSRASTILSSRLSSSFSFSISDCRDSEMIDAVLLVEEQIHLRSSSTASPPTPPTGATAAAPSAASTPSVISSPTPSPSRAAISASRAARLCFLALRTLITLLANFPTNPPPNALSTRPSAVGIEVRKASLRTLI